MCHIEYLSILAIFKGTREYCLADVFRDHENDGFVLFNHVLIVNVYKVL